MTGLLDQHETVEASVPRPAGRAALRGLGTAVPELVHKQDEIADELARAWGLRGKALARFERIVAGSGIDTRRGVLPIAEMIDLSTQERMQRYEAHAPPLAERAARRALREANLDPAEVTDLIVVSCTGFSAPGVDAALIERLGLRPDAQRLCVGFMGCFGAINGLRAAAGACAARPDAVALLVCVELCSLHIRRDAHPQNQVASALFADGAAAAVLRPGDADSMAASSANCSGVVDRGASLLLPEGRDWMTWRITDAGFAMTLTREVPTAVREHIRRFVAKLGAQPATLAVHPGGAGILDAVQSGLSDEPLPGLEASRAVLRRLGNMSSPTVLFVLDEVQRTRGVAALPCALLAFGPGLTLEGLTVRPERRDPATSGEAT